MTSSFLAGLGTGASGTIVLLGLVAVAAHGAVNRNLVQALDHAAAALHLHRSAINDAARALKLPAPVVQAAEHIAPAVDTVAEDVAAVAPLVAAAVPAAAPAAAVVEAAAGAVDQVTDSLMQQSEA